MSLSDLKQEVEKLLPEERRHLIAFLLQLQTSEDPALRTELTRKIDDPDPNRWISLADAKQRLAKP